MMPRHYNLLFLLIMTAPVLGMDPKQKEITFRENTVASIRNRQFTLKIFLPMTVVEKGSNRFGEFWVPACNFCGKRLRKMKPGRVHPNMRNHCKEEHGFRLERYMEEIAEAGFQPENGRVRFKTIESRNNFLKAVQLIDKRALPDEKYKHILAEERMQIQLLLN